MSLINMTPKWTNIIQSINVYLIRLRMKSEEKAQKLARDPYFIYNQWVRETGNNIAETDLAIWCVEYIQSMMQMSLLKLQKAVAIDGIRY